MYWWKVRRFNNTQNTQEIKTKLFNYTKQDKRCKFRGTPLCCLHFNNRSVLSEIHRRRVRLFDNNSVTSEVDWWNVLRTESDAITSKPSDEKLAVLKAMLLLRKFTVKGCRSDDNSISLETFALEISEWNVRPSGNTDVASESDI